LLENHASRLRRKEAPRNAGPPPRLAAAGRRNGVRGCCREAMNGLCVSEAHGPYGPVRAFIERVLGQAAGAGTATWWPPSPVLGVRRHPAKSQWANPRPAGAILAAIPIPGDEKDGARNLLADLQGRGCSPCLDPAAPAESRLSCRMSGSPCRAGAPGDAAVSGRFTGAMAALERAGVDGLPWSD